MKKINFIDLQKQYQKNQKNINESIQNVLDNSNFILGSQVSEFQNISSNYVGADCIGVANGTDALFISLKALGIKKGDEVITPSFTWVSTVETIKLIGAKPVYIDIKLDDFNIDESLVEELINEKTKAIMSVSIFGRCPDLARLKKIAEKYSIHLIEDAAQSYGAKNHDNMSCSIADISTTSFFPAKPLGCYGDGGAIYSKNQNLFEKASIISRHGQKGRYNYLEVGVNSRLDTIQAAILIEKHKIFEDEINMRNCVANSYEDNLKEIDEIETPTIPNQSNRSVWAQYTVLLSDSIAKHREIIMKDLKEQGIPTALYYPVLLHKTKTYEDSVHLPVSEGICDRVLSLPMHPYLEEDEIRSITSAIKETVKKYR